MSDNDPREVCCVCGQLLPPSFGEPLTDSERAKLRSDCVRLLVQLVAAVLGVPLIVVAVAKAIQLGANRFF